MQASDGMRRDTVSVHLGQRTYDIHIGENLLQEAGRHIAPLLNRPFAAIVTDENVARHHLKTLEASLAASGIKSVAIILPAGEKTKSFAALADLCEQLLAAGVERRDKIIAFGGGVIGDLTGFAAAILRRGLSSSRFQRRFWPRSTPPWVARPASTRHMAKISLAPFFSR